MKKTFHVGLFLLSLSFLAATAQAQGLDGDRSLPIDEYNDVPKGLLLDKGAAATTTAGTASKTENPTDKPPAEDGEDGAPRHMSYDTALKLYRQGKFADALVGLVPLANSGNNAALELLGVMTRMGQGVDKNPTLAAEYLTKAANDNRALAQHHLGVMYYTGEGVAPDLVQSLMWLQLAIYHYPDGNEKTRAMQDRDNVYKQMNRRTRDEAMKQTREFLERKGEAHLMDLQ